jgi:hypothetical protein
MARKTVTVSDKSGQAIPEGKGAKLRVIFTDARRGVREADLTDDEADRIARDTNARPAARRGRKPKGAS